MFKHSAFTLEDKQFIKEIASQGSLLRHTCSGAKILLLQNEDDNKVFTAAFKTIPEDETGVAHIIEHSVLCGSRKYPVKEPFVELIKSSMATFLNAMTYPDKTVYPIASLNHEDYHNLVDVYLDAVFFPDMKKEMFLQEGWHHTVEEDGSLGYKGVVLNEMKGVFSSPESVLHRSISKTLFPDTPYSNDSGGYPEAIPSLTYEYYKNFHEVNYHPSEALIIAYGDFDAERLLEQLDGEFLSEFQAPKQAREQVSLFQNAPNEPLERECVYAVTEGEELADKTFLLQAWSLGEVTDNEHVLDMTILDEILTGTPASPLRKALDASGLGSDTLNYGYDDSLLQGTFSIGVRDSSPEKADALKKLIEDTLTQLVKDGLPEKLLQSSMNRVEFKVREANYGSYPKGMVYSLGLLRNWLHNACPWEPLRYEASFTRLKKAVAEGNYFEQLIQQYFLDNSHRAFIICRPDENEAARIANTEKAALEKARSECNDAQLEALREQQQKLIKIQETPDSAENIDSIPTLSRSDMKREARKIEGTIEDAAPGAKLLTTTTMPSNGVCYIGLNFDASHLPLESLQQASLCATLMRQSGTSKLSFEELELAIGCHTGGLGANFTQFAADKDSSNIRRFFKLSGKCTIDKAEDFLALMQQILFDSDFRDQRKIEEILKQRISRIKSSFVRNGESMASRSAEKGLSLGAHLRDFMGGKKALAYLETTLAEFQKNFAAMQTSFQDLKNSCINRQGLIITLGCEKEDAATMQEHLKSFAAKLPASEATPVKLEAELHSENIAYATSGNVQYVARAASTAKCERQWKGDFALLNRLLASGYLWDRVRVQGGAYGCFLSFHRSEKILSLCSYRDPNLQETYTQYQGIADYLKNLDMSQDDLDKLLVGTLGKLDSPLTPTSYIQAFFNRFVHHISQEEIQQQRDDILDASVDDLRAYSEWFATLNEEGVNCVHGNTAKVEAASELFERIETLQGAGGDEDEDDEEDEEGDVD